MAGIIKTGIGQCLNQVHYRLFQQITVQLGLLFCLIAFKSDKYLDIQVTNVDIRETSSSSAATLNLALTNSIAQPWTSQVVSDPFKGMSSVNLRVISTVCHQSNIR